jgi:hypothetical protein
MLTGVVEFEVAGPGDFKPADFVQRQGFGSEALSGSVWVKGYCCVHLFALLKVVW